MIDIRKRDDCRRYVIYVIHRSRNPYHSERRIVTIEKDIFPPSYVANPTLSRNELKNRLRVNVKSRNLNFAREINRESVLDSKLNAPGERDALDSGSVCSADVRSNLY